MAVDCIIFGFDDGMLKLLIHKRKFEPFLDHWSLFGGFLRSDESLDDGARRILFELTGLENIYLEQLYAHGEPMRDPAGRVVSVSYVALIPGHKYHSGFSEQYDAVWIPLNMMPDLIMDHNDMVERGLKWLRRRASTRPIGFELLPEEFTIPRLQNLYEAILGEKLDKRNFRKKLLSMDFLKKLEEKDKTGSRKGAYLYKFDQQMYNKLVDNGFSFTI